MSAPPVPLAPESETAIADLLQQGRRVSEVIANGLNRQPGWRRAHVVELLTARGWKLDSDGRIPRQHRTTGLTPVGTLRGAPDPAPGTPVSWPENGAVTVDRSSIPQLIADGKAHSAAKVRRAAERADAAIRDLRAAVAANSEQEAIRKRLAELDAERDRLRAQLSGVARPAKAPRPRATPAADKQIEHGTWGGYLAESYRGADHCGPCETAKDEVMAARRTRKAAQ